MVTDNIGHIKDIVLRTERLASATYLVSGYLPDPEPLKWRLRERVIELTTLVLSLNAEFIPAKVSQLIEEIIMLLNLALLNPGVSEMNFSLLRQEYMGLRQLIGNLKLDLLLPRISNEVPKLESKTHQTKIQSPINPPPAPDRREGGQARRELILQYIRSSGAAPSIKDISQAVPGVSTKTVQRELADLVGAGVLKREGDRRWSRYSLSANRQKLT